MLNKKSKLITVLSFMLIVSCVFLLSGCGDEPKRTDASVGSTGSVGLSAENDKDADGPDGSEENGRYELSMSYANIKYIEEGDESLPKLIRGVAGSIDDAEGKSDEELIKSAIDALKNVPGDIEGAETLVTGKIGINKVEVDGSTCNIDVEGDKLEEIDIYEEQFFIYQVADTVLSSFDDIESVSFTVDGQTADYLNYVDISSPVTAKSIEEFNSAS